MRTPSEPEDTSATDLHLRLWRSSWEATSLLDVGCGHGAHLRNSVAQRAMEELKGRGGALVGIDVHVPDEPHPVIEDLRPMTVGGGWPVETGSVDVAYSDWVLEHVTDPDDYFAECARVLRPGGTLHVRTLQRWSVAGLGARVVPNRWHQRVISTLQPGMNSEDVFPTALTCNTQAALRHWTSRHGLEVRDYRVHTGLWGYAGGSRRAARVLRGLEGALPRGLRQTLVATILKPGDEVAEGVADAAPPQGRDRR